MFPLNVPIIDFKEEVLELFTKHGSLGHQGVHGMMAKILTLTISLPSLLCSSTFTYISHIFNLNSQKEAVVSFLIRGGKNETQRDYSSSRITQLWGGRIWTLVYVTQKSTCWIRNICWRPLFHTFLCIRNQWRQIWDVEIQISLCSQGFSATGGDRSKYRWLCYSTLSAILLQGNRRLT